jgi:hypothetical protein
MAMTLQTIMTRATLGDQLIDAGAMARRGAIMMHLLTPHLPGPGELCPAPLRLVHLGPPGQPPFLGRRGGRVGDIALK